MSGRRFLALVAAFSLLLSILLLTPLGTKLQTAMFGQKRYSPGKPSPAFGSGSGTTPHPSKTSRPALQPIPTAEAYIRSKLERTIIPVLDFEDTTFEEALDFLRQRSRELDPDHPEPERKGVSFVVRKKRLEVDSPTVDAELDAEAGLIGDDPGTYPIERFYAENISVAKALDEICRRAGLRWSVGEKGILIVPEEKTP